MFLCLTSEASSAPLHAIHNELLLSLFCVHYFTLTREKVSLVKSLVGSLRVFERALIWGSKDVLSRL